MRSVIKEATHFASDIRSDEGGAFAYNLLHDLTEGEILDREVFLMNEEFGQLSDMRRPLLACHEGRNAIQQLVRRIMVEEGTQ